MSGETWLVTGASGLLGRAACVALHDAGHRVVAVRNRHAVGIPGLEEVVVDLTDPEIAGQTVERFAPTTVVHAAGLTDVDRCEAEPALARRIHVDASSAVAAAASSVGARLVHISTDHLWDGSQPNIDEDTPPCPLNVYGATKLDAERVVLEAHAGALVVRTNFFGQGPRWRRSLSDWVLTELEAGREVHAFADVYFTPIHLRLLIESMLALLEVGAAGVLHVAGSERISKYDFACRLATRLGLDVDRVMRSSVSEAHLAAARPSDMSLSTTRAAVLLGGALPNLDVSLSALADGICSQRS